MGKLCLSGLTGFFALALTVSVTTALERVKFVTPIKESPIYYLPVLAAEELGFSKQNGLELEWLPLRGGGLVARALAARAVSVGFNMAASVIEAAAAGVPMSGVAELSSKGDFMFWVSADSRLKQPEDLRGARVGVSSFGGIGHAYSRIVVKALGLEKEVKFIVTGGVPEGMAAIKTGVIDTYIQPMSTMIERKIKKEMMEFIVISEYVPKEWLDNLIIADKEFALRNAATVKRIVRAILQSVEFIKANPGWTVEKVKATSGYSVEGAAIIYENMLLRLTKSGRVDKRALENVRSFMIEYGLVSKEKAPPVDQVFIEGFTP